MKIKRLFKLFTTYLSLMLLVVLTACNGGETTDEKTMYTVTFDSNGGTPIEDIQVEDSRLLPTDVKNPNKSVGENTIYEFLGWFKDNDTFSDEWDIDVDIVTSDITLFAKWREISTLPTEIKMTTDEFSSSVTWLQANVNDQSSFVVTLDGVETDGSVTVNGNTVVWTPLSEIQGKKYVVGISVDGGTETKSSPLYFKGVGSESNPFLIANENDIYAITTKDAGEGKYYKVVEEFDVVSSYSEIEGNVFNGYINGNRKAIGVTGNAGLFYELGEDAVLEKVTVKNSAQGGISTTSNPQIGAIASINKGLIKDSISYVKVENSAGLVGDATTVNEGGAGGFVGTNETTGQIINVQFISTDSSNGTIKASIGAGGIVSINKGLIDNALNKGTIGAGNSNESSKTLSRYSYAGGIAGFNYGTISQSATTDAGKLLAQRYYSTTLEGTDNNKVFGGIVGYNAEGATVSESYFDGIRVHADQYVGGVAGVNAGIVTDSYVGGRYYEVTGLRSYVGGRVNIGGIVGELEGSGSVTNSYFAGNIYSYEEAPYAIAETSTNSVYIKTNHDVRSTGDAVYDNVKTNDFTAPNGTGNMAISNVSLSNNTSNYVFTDTDAVLNVINGNSKFEVIDNNISLIPTIDRNYTYTIKFDANGGLGQMEDLTCFNDSEYTLTPNALTADGYTFVGWESEGTAYNDGYTLKDLGTENQVITLKAIWLKDDATPFYSEEFTNNVDGVAGTMQGEKDSKQYDVVTIGDWSVYNGATGDNSATNVSANVTDGELVVNASVTSSDTSYKNFYLFRELPLPSTNLGDSFYVQYDVTVNDDTYTLWAAIRSISPGYSRPVKNVTNYVEHTDLSSTVSTVGGLHSIYTTSYLPDNGYTTALVLPLANGNYDGDISISIDNINVYTVGSISNN